MAVGSSRIYGEDCNRRRRSPDRNGWSSAREAMNLVTRDFLGGSKSSSSPRAEARELDLDFEVPSGYEKRLDLKSGKVYLQRCSSSNSLASSSSQNNTQTNPTAPKLQDLNFPPSSWKPPSTFFEEPSMELKLFPSPPPSSPPPTNYHCICTLERVRSALERAERESANMQSPFQPWSKSPSPSRSPPNHSSSIKGTKEYDAEKPISSSTGLLFAAGCPSCLLYVLISKINPKCPRCHSIIPSPTASVKKPRRDRHSIISSPTATVKKPRLDLNISV